MGTAALSHIMSRWPDAHTAESAPALVERDDALRRLDLLFEDCAASRGATVVVAGGAGAGKTALLHAFMARAARAGATVLEAFGSCAERDLPLGVLRQLSRGGSRAGLPGATGAHGSDGLLPDTAFGPSADMSTGLSAAVHAAPAGHPRPHLLQDLWVALRTLSEHAPVVLAVDDTHLVDTASLRGLIYLGRRLGSQRVLLIATELADPAGDRLRNAWQTDLLRQPRCHRLRVGELSVRGVAEVLTPRLGASAAREAAPGWRDLTGGNPLLLRALVEDLPAAPGPAPAGQPAQPSPGEAFGKAVLTCLRRGGEPLLRVARGIAVLEEAGSAALLPRLLDVDPAVTRPVPARILDTLEVAGVLRAGRFRHTAARAAVLADLDGPARTALHRRAAELLYSAGAPAEDVAVHLVAAEHAREPWGLDVLCRAAVTALVRDDVGCALECLRLAGLACEDDDQRATVALLRARVEWRINPGAALRHVEPLVPALLTGQLPSQHALTLVKLMLWHGREDDATAGLRELETRRDQLDAQSLAGLDLIREYLQANHPPLVARISSLDGADGWRPKASALSVAASATDGPLLPAVTTLTGVLRTGANHDTVRTAEWVLQATPLDDVTLGSLEWALLVLVYADRADIAASWCDQFLREAALRQAPTWQAMLSGIRAEVAVHQGDSPAAEQHARAALTLIPGWTWGVGIGRPLSALIAATTVTGSHAVDQVAAPIPDAMFQTRFGLQYLYARGQQRLSHGRLHAALDDLLTCGRLMTAWDIDLPSFVPWRVEAALTLVRLGRTAEARALADEHLSRPGGGRVRGMGLRALAATLDARERPPVLLAAVDILQERGDRLQLAYALADLSDAHRRSGELTKARMITRRAVLLAQECGAEPLRQRLTDRSGDDTPGYGGIAATLSAAELQVAMLAASGRTNREIAKKLYITVSTVEQHLTRAYRKLRVNGRADLPVILQV
ncbi:helix-turn-helix transcriptional regulator [Candidatus Protofrankia californiensis]|uniref:helix-turn-helix transcriptional regulator n=1 Tax=Candidatus Protofrankia californiensis TaxID=1839754 RepID=UPI001041B1FA|nr:LuxR family transcriptional regulator [Candidatus Protofrankia californiensis]